MEVSLVAYNGKESAFSQELATPGCDPIAKVTIRRKGRRATLVARMRAARVGPGDHPVRAAAAEDAGARQGAGPSCSPTAGGCRPQTGKRRLATMPFPREVRTATLVWRGLKARAAA